MSESYEGRQIVGMDLHRRRSVLVRMTEAGERLETVRIANDPEYLRAVMTRAGEHPVDLAAQIRAQPDQLGPMPHQLAQLPSGRRGDPRLAQPTHP